MELKNQKRLAAQVLKCSPKKVRLDPQNSEEIKEAITKADIRALIIDKVITKNPGKRSSKSRIRKHLEQKRKGKQSGLGSRKGKGGARTPKKKLWMAKIRLQRALLKELLEKDHVSVTSYRELYKKAKGGFFRSKRHLKLYISERGLFRKNG